MRLISRILAALVVLGLAPIATADILTVTLSNQNDIVIPVFTGTGTLNSVNLKITLRAGMTASSSPASQNHGGTISILSTDSSSNAGATTANLGSTPLPTTTNSGGAGQLVSTPTYSGSGINVGTFDLTTASVSDHAHNLTVSSPSFEVNTFFDGFVNVTETRLRVSVTPSSEANAQHSFTSVEKNLSFGSGSLTPFLGGSNITISAGSFSTPSSSHQHSYSFSWIYDDPNPLLDTSYSFSGTLASDSHTHLIDPTFDIEATFDFTPFNAVPEPSTILLSSLALGGIVVRRFRRKQK